MKKLAVFGLGRTGRSVCQFLERKQIEVVVSDDKVCSLDGTAAISPQALEEMLTSGRISSLIISPGIAMTHPLIQKAQEVGVEVFCDIEYAFRQRSHGLIGITGTNGKTTTTLLTTHLMHAAQREAKAVGNVGIPILDEIEFPGYLVVELSSFQLQTVKTPSLTVGCLLNISANHLDYHRDMQEYVEAKLRIASLVQPGGAFFVGEAVKYIPFGSRIGFDPSCNPPCDIFSDGYHIWRYGIQEEEVPERLRGTRSHDLENFLAAFSICRHIGISARQCMDGYATFCKPAHRIQHVGAIGGVHIYDDSKATNIDAVLSAVQAVDKNIILIAGGVHKGFPYHAWAAAFRGKVKKAFLMGPAASFMEQDLAGSIPLQMCSSFEEAVISAMEYAQEGDSVLLSPGCSSYDRFANFEERGRAFQQLINLKGGNIL